MRRRVAAVVTGSGLALAIAVCLPGSCGSGNRVDATAAQGAAPAAPSRPRTIPAATATGVVRPADTPPHPGAALGGGRSTFPEESSVARALAAYTADELALFAEFERLTGREAPVELLLLVERRRARVDADELIAAATLLFAGDPLGRAAALGWLRAHAQR